MNNGVIAEAQEFLTVSYPDRTWKIKVEELFHKHSVEEVVEYLKHLLSDHRKRLARLILKDKTDPRINETVAIIFRLRMAITILLKARGKKKEAA